MRLHNTLTRQTQEFKPQKPGEATLYTCGPTVYNYYHIGNLRNAVFNDTLRRTLEASGYTVKHVMNITDVGHLVSDADEGEDKLEKGAAREGKSVWDVAQHYTEAFKADMAAMNVLPPSVDPKREKNQTHHDTYARATDFIPEQIEMVKLLLDKGFAYQTKQAIYFDVTKLKDYGILTGQKLSEKEVAARSDVVTDPDKRSPHDFAVWFFAVGRYQGHTMHWPTPWGEGFPGWHLECSAIIHTLLGDPIDIHTGGVDHIGTHHPNEMAQTEAAFGHPLAHYWVHNEFILVDGAKMAKSKGNSYTLKDIIDRGFHPLALRLLYLQAHYRSEINFTWESLEAAQNRLLEYEEVADLKYQPPTDGSVITVIGPDTATNILSYMQDDMRSPDALANLSERMSFIKLNTPIASQFDVFQRYLEQIDKLLGLDLAHRPDITAAQKQLIAEREVARQAKDWTKSDQLRDELASQNLTIEDTPHGPRWRRTTVTAK
jgi:cysteinyl-tRNA synthetase